MQHNHFQFRPELEKDIFDGYINDSKFPELEKLTHQHDET
jgi:hypothetical protein